MRCSRDPLTVGSRRPLSSKRTACAIKQPQDAESTEKSVAQSNSQSHSKLYTTTQVEATTNTHRSIQREGPHTMVVEDISCHVCLCNHVRVRYWCRISISLRSSRCLRFLVVPSAFIKNTDLTVKPTSAAIVGGTFVVLGYIISATLCFICKSWLFRLDCILG